MVEDEDKKEEEEQLKFDSAGEAITYIGVNQAMVMAMEHARDNQ